MLFIEFFMKNAYFILIYVFFDIVDFAFGFSNAWKNNEVQSRKMKLGILKFFGYLLIIFCCICIDVMIYLGTGVPIIDTLSPIAKICTTFIIVIEFISIIENASLLGLPIPKFLLKLVEVLKQNNEEK